MGKLTFFQTEADSIEHWIIFAEEFQFPSGEPTPSEADSKVV